MDFCHLDSIQYINSAFLIQSRGQYNQESYGDNNLGDIVAKQEDEGKIPFNDNIEQVGHQLKPFTKSYSSYSDQQNQPMEQSPMNEDDLQNLIYERRQQLRKLVHSDNEEDDDFEFTFSMKQQEKNDAIFTEQEEDRGLISFKREQDYRTQKKRKQKIHKNLQDSLTVRVFLYFSDQQINQQVKELMLMSQTEEELKENHHQVSEYLYIDIQIPAYVTNKDLIAQCIDYFNIKLRDMNSSIRMTQFENLQVADDSRFKAYELYMANKRGAPKDDYPDCDYTQIVSQTKCLRFTLKVLVPQAFLQTTQKGNQKLKVLELNMNNTGNKVFQSTYIQESQQHENFYDIPIDNDLSMLINERKSARISSKTTPKQYRNLGSTSSNCGSQNCCLIY